MRKYGTFYIPPCQELFKSYLLQCVAIPCRRLSAPHHRVFSGIGEFLSLRRTHSLIVTFIRHPARKFLYRRPSFLIQAFEFRERPGIVPPGVVSPQRCYKRALSPNNRFFRLRHARLQQLRVENRFVFHHRPGDHQHLGLDAALFFTTAQVPCEQFPEVLVGSGCYHRGMVQRIAQARVAAFADHSHRASAALGVQVQPGQADHRLSTVEAMRIKCGLNGDGSI